jgi:hypothetical protein
MAATALLRHTLAMAALGVPEEGGEGAVFRLSLGRCIEERKRALRRHRRPASGYVRLGEVLLSRHHRRL